MEQPKSKLTYTEMLQKLDSLYSEKEALQEKITQLQYDIEFLENMIMYRMVKTEVKKKEWPR
jgi:predicted nuclease with TOPRIM domain